ncbi:hypothetical protein UXH90_23980, partial [Escherichia coli]|nr:hypothetical protein [Escherichia coli]
SLIKQVLRAYIFCGACGNNRTNRGGFQFAAARLPWFNSHGCNGCWDDTSLNFDHKDFLWCPRHKNTDRQFECTRLITGAQVNGVISRLHASLPGQEEKVLLTKGTNNE